MFFFFVIFNKTQHKRLMKYFFTFLLLFFLPPRFFAQNVQEFLFTPTDESLFVPVTTEKRGNYISLTFHEPSIHQLFHDKNITEYRKAFGSVKEHYLEKVYYVKVENSDLTLSRLLANNYIEYGEEMEKTEVLIAYPNDFMLPDDTPNDYLELIRAPLAWSVTKGDPNMLIGIADTWFNTVHEELANKMVAISGDNIADQGLYSHGIEVASIAAGDTNNGVGLSSIGYNTKMIGYIGINTFAVDQLAQNPDVKVINMSWSGGGVMVYINDLLTYIRDVKNIVLVAAAGNGKFYNPDNSQFGYHYPASLDPVISVGGVGSRYYRGTANAEGVQTNWKDVAVYYINDPESTMTVNDKVNVVAPSFDIYRASNTNEAIGSVDTYMREGPGTSSGAPIVSGLAALVIAANPTLTAAQVKQIIEETTDSIDHIPENAPFAGKLGTGRINAYRAVMRAHCMLNPSDDLDLMIRDSKEDHGDEPNILTGDELWNSTDIWVRNQLDEIEEHQNPEYHPTQPSYIYVRVFNKSCRVSSGTEKVKVYWAKASTSLDWDTFWNGEHYFPDNGPLLGAPVGEVSIPALEPGQDAVVRVPWLVPNPAAYNAINPEPWHFCLLARIESPDDLMAVAETAHLRNNVKNNNNIAWKNLTVVNLTPDNLIKPIGGVIAVGNPLKIRKTFSLRLVP